MDRNHGKRKSRSKNQEEEVSTRRRKRRKKMSEKHLMDTAILGLALDGDKQHLFLLPSESALENSFRFFRHLSERAVVEETRNLMIEGVPYVFPALTVVFQEPRPWLFAKKDAEEEVLWKKITVFNLTAIKKRFEAIHGGILKKKSEQEKDRRKMVLPKIQNVIEEICNNREKINHLVKAQGHSYVCCNIGALKHVGLSEDGIGTSFFCSDAFLRMYIQKADAMVYKKIGIHLVKREGETERGRLLKDIAILKGEIARLQFSLSAAEKKPRVVLPDQYREENKLREDRGNWLDQRWKFLSDRLKYSNVLTEADVFITAVNQICQSLPVVKDSPVMTTDEETNWDRLNRRHLELIGKDFFESKPKRIRLLFLSLMYKKNSRCNFWQKTQNVINHVSGLIRSVDRLHDLGGSTSQSNYYDLEKQATRVARKILVYLYSRYQDLDIVLLGDNYNTYTKAHYVKRKNNEWLHRALKVYWSDRKFASAFNNDKVKLDLDDTKEHCEALKRGILKSYKTPGFYHGKLRRKRLVNGLIPYDEKFFEECTSSKNCYSVNLLSGNCKQWKFTLPRMIDLIARVKAHFIERKSE